MVLYEHSAMPIGKTPLNSSPGKWQILFLVEARLATKDIDIASQSRNGARVGRELDAGRVDDLSHGARRNEQGDEASLD